MTSPDVEVGQVWRRNKNGRHIVISRENGKGSGDFAWEGVDYRARGVSYDTYIKRDCTLVAQTLKEHQERNQP